MGTITFKKVGRIEWRVYVDGQSVGLTWGNGSRMRERSWDYKATDGERGRTGSRRAAAELLARRAAKQAD